MASRVTIRDNRRGLDQLKRELKAARRRYVVIGITNQAGGEVLTYANANEFGARIKQHTTGTITQYRNIKTNKLTSKKKAMARPDKHYAKDYTVQFKGHTIPSRPFMRSYYDENLKKIGDFAERQFLMLLTTDSGSVDQVFNAIGLFVQNGVKNRIRTSKSWAVPNSPFTIAKKGSDKPLVDHGIMINSVTFDLRSGR